MVTKSDYVEYTNKMLRSRHILKIEMTLNDNNEMIYTLYTFSLSFSLSFSLRILQYFFCCFAFAVGLVFRHSSCNYKWSTLNEICSCPNKQPNIKSIMSLITLKYLEKSYFAWIPNYSIESNFQMNGIVLTMYSMI